MAVAWLAFQLHIWGIPGSISYFETSYSECKQIIDKADLNKHKCDRSRNNIYHCEKEVQFRNKL
jgi:hypothetical protein